MSFWNRVTITTIITTVIYAATLFGTEQLFNIFFKSIPVNDLSFLAFLAATIILTIFILIAYHSPLKKLLPE